MAQDTVETASTPAKRRARRQSSELQVRGLFRGGQVFWRNSQKDDHRGLVPSTLPAQSLFPGAWKGWGDATGELIAMFDAAERRRAFQPALVVDIRARRQAGAKSSPCSSSQWRKRGGSPAWALPDCDLMPTHGLRSPVIRKARACLVQHEHCYVTRVGGLRLAGRESRSRRSFLAPGARGPDCGGGDGGIPAQALSGDATSRARRAGTAGAGFFSSRGGTRFFPVRRSSSVG